MTTGHPGWRWVLRIAPAALIAAAVTGPMTGHVHAQQTRSATTQPGQTKPWSIDDALPTNSPAAQSRETKTTPTAKSAVSKSEAAKPSLGRLPLRDSSGSFGIETETKVKSTEFPDGRPAPGVETTQRRPPSYFGLSISVPTGGK